MTVAAKTPLKNYLEDGVTMQFPVPFRYNSTADLTVLRVVNGVSSTLVLGTDYSATAAPTDAGGTLTLLSTVNGAVLRIGRDTARAQPDAYNTNDSFPAKTLEGGLDRTMLVAQEQDASIEDYGTRSLQVPVGETIGNLPSVDSRKGSLLGWDAAGNPIASQGSGADGALRGDMASLAAGSALMAFTHSLAYARPTVGAKLQQDNNPLDHPYLATGDGVADDRAALFNADHVAPTVITSNHYIASNLAFSRPVEFRGVGRLTIAPGATVTFTSDIDAPNRQIFYGAGVVSGLALSKVAWFAGDLLNTTTDADALIQRAYDACILPSVIQNTRAVVEWPVGYFCSNGAGINVVKGQHTIGKGEYSSRLMHLTAVANGFICSGVGGPIIEGLGMVMQSPNMIATSGVQAWFKAGALNGYIKDCYLVGGWIAKRWTGVNGGKSLNVDAIDTMACVDYIDGSAAIEVTGGNNSTFSDFVDLSTTAGFIPGESIIWTGGNGSWGYTTSSTRAKIIINDVHPPVGGTITGATSGATATLSALKIGFALGGLRIVGNSPAFIITNNEYSGGQYAWLTDATTNAHGSRPEYGTVSNNYFDHSDGGSILNNLSATSLTANWFASRQGDGCTLQTTIDMTISGGNKFMSSWGGGLLVYAGSVGTVITGNDVAGNNRSNQSKDGIHVLPGTTDFTITSNRVGGQTAPGFDGTQRAGIYVDAGASDRYIIEQNLVGGNAIVGVNDSGTGTNKSVARNF